MLTTSEIAATAAIWVLLAIGGFFCIRAAVRKITAKKQTIKNR
ncbi:hypothetical protein Glov_0222 [Trichlorobacter lovleyi SZ]|uniref:Uncharacterized protein n=1 Tax=Trichlorobacter lovleyi (strain ATCC BAA-1151 / DSM 17278 / SZ) TaxID=398767 RepID=B3EAW9_TRIL1|nr:hypothetical protein Glov_0222 [Trichlorobacter lovleyi SZ]